MSQRSLRSPWVRLAIATATGTLVTMASVVPATAAGSAPSPGDNLSNSQSSTPGQSLADNSQSATPEQPATDAGDQAAAPDAPATDAADPADTGDAADPQNDDSLAEDDGLGMDDGLAEDDTLGEDEAAVGEEESDDAGIDAGADGSYDDGANRAIAAANVTGGGDGRDGRRDDRFNRRDDRRDDRFDRRDNLFDRFDRRDDRFDRRDRRDDRFDRRHPRSVQGVVIASRSHRLRLHRAPSFRSRVIASVRDGRRVRIFCQTRGRDDRRFDRDRDRRDRFDRRDRRRNNWYLVQLRRTWAWGPADQIHIIGNRQPRRCSETRTS